jgi:hypothetical protein
MSEENKKVINDEEESEKQINISLYQPHKFQQAIHHYCSDAHPATFIFAVAGRQSGKSFCALFQMVYWALSNNNCKLMWVSPTLQQANHIFLQLIAELGSAGLIAKKNQTISGMWIELVNGSVIFVRSAASVHSLRGYTIQKLIVDEAAYVDYQTYTEVLLPMLNTKRPGIKNKILLATTPKGKLNWIYQEFMKVGKDQAYAGIRWTSFDNPARNEDIIMNFKKSLSDAAFNQEFLALWQDQFSIFSNVIDCATIPNILPEPQSGDKYIMSIDPGMVKDYTSVCFINQKSQVVYIERFRKITNVKIKNRIVELVNYWKPYKVVIEVTGIGRPIANDLKYEHGIYIIEEWETSNTSKSVIIEELANAFDKKAIRIPKNPDYLIKELLDFTAYPQKNGKFKYESASGHDDAVVSLAIAYHFFKKYNKSGGRYVIK